MGKHGHADPGPVLGNSISCRSHEAIGVPKMDANYPFAVGKRFIATL